MGKKTRTPREKPKSVLEQEMLERFIKAVDSDCGDDGYGYSPVLDTPPSQRHNPPSALAETAPQATGPNVIASASFSSSIEPSLF